MIDVLSFDINSIVTLLVGLIAFGVYSKQKWDKKRNAAKAIFIEIQTAEMNLEKIKKELSRKDDDVYLPEDIFLMPIESWSVNRQDFIKDFRSDEWSSIDDFYSKCKFYDQNAQHNAQAFAKNEEQIRINAHRMIANYADSLIGAVAHVIRDPEHRGEVDKEYEKFYEKEKYVRENYLGSNDIRKPIYRPQKYLDQARIYSNSIDPLLLGTVGKKLDSIANRGGFEIYYTYISNKLQGAICIFPCITTSREIYIKL